ncbi:hypothetical protein [Curtobacterium sp. SORGH_AS_0776]|uniref:hypothetical protein n=1 Tax=Curtobacterium sp. SORGH_AS_0776 TaxID=3041798 RepID=UPI002858BD72|nr:hypothetical protein [Curtobacterium sp. SORGH_AS_0776]MDR6171953.1 hypothetical protein [Curtobacterium sp. SORGH_AS_0776]
MIAAERAARIATAVQAAAPLPNRVNDLDEQSRRHLAILALREGVPPETYYREALTNNRARSARDAHTDAVVAAVRAER